MVSVSLPILLPNLSAANNGVVPQNTFAGETLDDRLLNSVARDIGRDWKMLSRHLGLDETSIQSIQQAHFSDLHEASYQALLRLGNYALAINYSNTSQMEKGFWSEGNS